MTVVSSVETDLELEAYEARHICPEKMLAELLAKSKPQSQPPAIS